MIVVDVTEVDAESFVNQLPKFDPVAFLSSYDRIMGSEIKRLRSEHTEERSCIYIHVSVLDVEEDELILDGKITSFGLPPIDENLEVWFSNEYIVNKNFLKTIEESRLEGNLLEISYVEARDIAMLYRTYH